MHYPAIAEDELIARARTRLGEGALSQDQIADFTSKHVHGVEVNGLDVLIVDQEWKGHKGELNPVLQAFIRSPSTDSVMIEYYYPELLKQSRKYPVLGKGLGWLCERNDQVKKRKEFFNPLADICARSGKPILVADIADKLEYELHYSAPASLYFPVSALSVPLAITSLGFWFFCRYQEWTGSGLFDKKSVHKIEQFMVDLEDARRLFVAKGIEDYCANHEAITDERPQMVVIYPRAHAIRIADYLTNPDPVAQASKTVKTLFYSLYPFLDRHYRLYYPKVA